MRFQELIEKNKEEMIRDLQGAIRCPSVEAKNDGSGYPFGQGVQDCLEYTLGVCEKLGFATTNLDNYVGWWATWTWFPKGRAGAFPPMKAGWKTAASTAAVPWTTKAPPMPPCMA